MVITYNNMTSQRIIMKYWIRHSRIGGVAVRPVGGALSVTNYHVSRLLNFLVTTLPTSMPNRSTIRCAKSGWDVPLNTLMFGILLLATFERVETKLDLTRHRARMGSDDNKGILPRRSS